MKIFRKITLSPLFFIQTLLVCFGFFCANAQAAKISILQFNVENLFDTIHDEGKNDYTSMPLNLKRSSKFLDSPDGKKFMEACVGARFPKWRMSCLTYDWSQNILDQKLIALAKVISSVNSGKGADLVFLQEVENLRVLKMLNKKLKGLNYTPVLIEGKDERGIDVALLTRYPVKSSVLHDIPFKNVKSDRAKDTRGILQVSMTGPLETSVEAFVVHFPAPFHPTFMREQSLEFLNQVTKKYHGKAIVVAAGDYNITREEDEKKSVTLRYSKESWNVSHLVGCKKCKGSNYYAPKKSWSFLDHIWVSSTLEPLGWKLVNPSIQIANNTPEQTNQKPFPHPKRMELTNGKLSGVSDHWPVYLELKK